MSHLDKKVFGKKSYSDLLKEIYDNQKKKETQITALINELKPLISDIGDATMIVPLIKEYMELGIKNDEALIKVATIFNVYLQMKVMKKMDLAYLRKKKNNFLKK